MTDLPQKEERKKKMTALCGVGYSAKGVQPANNVFTRVFREHRRTKVPAGQGRVVAEHRLERESGTLELS